MEGVRETEIEVFFDGECPLCQREIAFLRKIDRQQRVAFTDIAAPDFDAARAGLAVDHAALMARIHARLPDGSLIEGVEVFRRLYTAVGWGVVVRWSRLPGLAALADAAYAVFARNRLRLTGRSKAACNASCAVPQRTR